MFIERTCILLFKEIRQSYKNFVFFFVVLAPIMMSLVVTLVFGQMFLGKPNLGILEGETSEMVTLMEKNMKVFLFENKDQMLKQIEAGKLDAGIVFSPGFDVAVKNGDTSGISTYIFGGCPIQKITALSAGFSSAIMALTGRDSPAVIQPRILGNAEAKPWYIRLLPLLVLLAVMMSGLLIPATALASEKQNKTLGALLITPVHMTEVVTAKVIFGFLMSFIMGFLILFMNNAMTENIGITLLVLALGALTASILGSLFGYRMKDVLSVMNLIKSFMLILYAPAILNLFPQLPGWIQKMFPTYYIFSPLMKLSEGTFSLAADGWEILVLAGLLAVFTVILSVIVKQTKQENIVPA